MHCFGFQGKYNQHALILLLRKKLGLHYFHTSMECLKIRFESFDETFKRKCKVKARRNENTKMLDDDILLSIFSTLNRRSCKGKTVVLFISLSDLLSVCYSFLSGIINFFPKIWYNWKKAVNRKIGIEVFKRIVAPPKIGKVGQNGY